MVQAYVPADAERVQLTQRIRHPLQSLRGWIRRYIFLEGMTLAVLYLAAWFWLGLALDYGPFRLLTFDWIQELNEALEADTARLVRGGLLAALGLGLVVLLAVQLVNRLLREFREPALALVLERHFPQELGDRLITAVELADPRLAQRYGYSQAMIEQTLRDAAARVERLPVQEVFNWRRLRRLALLAVASLLVPLLLSGAGYALWAWSQEQPLTSFWPRLANVAILWTERNILLQDVYWPRQALLELHRFADTPAHPGEMRIARDEQRPDLLVRAIRWVVADRQAPGGWRPLMWRDLPAFLPADLLDVPLPRDWDGWIFDPDDLDFPLANTVLPAEWRGKPAHFLRRQLKEDTRLVQRLQAAGALEPLRRWLDWHNWSLDQLERQLMPVEKTEVREPMRRQYPQAVRCWEELFAHLNDLAEQPTMELYLRRLESPDVVFFTYRGLTTKGQTPHKQEEGSKYLISLGELKESVRFTVRGADYSTPSQQLTLVPPPGLTSLVMDKEEPAYIYWRLQGDQTPLKGKRQYFAGIPLSLTGEITQLALPLGSSLRLRARSERQLQDRVLLLPPQHRRIAGSLTPTVSVQRDADAQGFQFVLSDLRQPLEFELHFFDEDGVRGRRHVVIEPLDDRGPQEVVPVELAVTLRQLRSVGKNAAIPTGFLVTPDAALPLKGTFTDDYGLSAMDWVWQGEEIEFELLTPGVPRTGKAAEKEVPLPADGTRLRRLGLVVSGLIYFPLSPGTAWAFPAHWSWLERFLTFDLRRGQVPWSTFTGQAPLKGFQERLQEREILAIPALALEEKLRQQPPKEVHLRTYSLERNETFDFRQYLPGLKPRDPTKESQRHYRLQLFVAATDNNIDTGPTRVLSKVPITLLVVSENELLAQILLEEETLRARLERALEKLKTARTSVQEQISKLQLADPPLELIALRLEEVRDRFVPDAGNLVREVANDYQRILREMEVNRVQEQRLDTVDKKICRPLEEILAPNLGQWARTEAALRQCSESLDADLGPAKNGPTLSAARRELHVKNALQAQEQLARLIEQLEAVLQAIGGELVERELIALLVEIEQRQRNQSEVLRRRWEQLQRELLEFLRNPSGREK